MFSKKTDDTEADPDEPAQVPRRGRPRGPTQKSARTQAKLYRVANELFAEHGYEATTLRAIARKAGVSPGLLYRYFPSKRSVVLALYDDLSLRFAERVDRIPGGRWRDRFVGALRASLDVLGAHRSTLAALVPVLVGGREEGLFSPTTAFSRERVQRAFVDAVTGAKDAPKQADAAALGRVLYLAHLGVVLWWLLDRSPGQRTTRLLVALLERALPVLGPVLKLAPARRLVRDLDALVRDGLFGGTAGADTA